MNYRNDLITAAPILDNYIFKVLSAAQEKENKHITTKLDILALSVALYHYRTTQAKSNYAYPNISSLLDERLENMVTVFDRSYANTIRDYYSKKLMVYKLKDHKLTKFREDLGRFIHGSPTTFLESMIPLAYRLPEFYQYDIEFDSFVNLFNRDTSMYAKHSHERIKVSLTPMKKMNIVRSRKPYTEYWLADPNMCAFNMLISNDNSLFGVWDKLFERGPVDLIGYLTSRSRDGFKYLKLDKLVLA